MISPARFAYTLRVPGMGDAGYAPFLPLTTRVALLEATVGSFAPIQLAFGWTQTDNVPLLLGQVNFFAAFDLCFYRSQLAFEISPEECNRAGEHSPALSF